MSAAAVADVLADAAGLAEAGRYRDAIDRLTEANRVVHDPAVEHRLVALRRDGFGEEPPARPPAAVAPVRAAPLPVGPLPELRPEQLDLATLREGLSRHGAVLVRGLVPPARVEALRTGIDMALDGCDAGLGGAKVEETLPWFAPFEAKPGATYRVGGRRKWMRAGGGMWAVDSPRMLFELVELLDELGIGRLVEEHLGERPALSANKCNLRRAAPGNCGDWHQDGAFLGGAATKSLNLWMTLSDCGMEADAPTMDIVPRRLDHVVPTGTEGAHFDWAVSPAMAAEAAGDVEIVRPEFRAGDAMLFDHLFLHRTAATPEMRNERHAIETWFFAPSAYPDGQIPILY